MLSDTKYFNSKLHEIAYIINGNELINQLRDELKMYDKLLSIGELDNIIYATLLYNNSTSYDQIPIALYSPLKIHDIYKWLHSIYLDTIHDNEYL
jgi:hypothetical protein